MRDRSSFKTEVQWLFSSFAALMAVVLLVSAISIAGSFATASTRDLQIHGISDRFYGAIGAQLFGPIAILFVFYQFFAAGAVGFRLLVPTFAGAPPRAVAAVVTTWPALMGAAIISNGDIVGTLLLGLIALGWSQLMPLPKETIFKEGTLRGGIIVGFAFGAFALYDGLLLAIFWCSYRLYKGKTLEVSATAICAALVPSIFLFYDLSATLNSSVGRTTLAEGGVLLALAVGGVVLSKMPARPERDEYDDEEPGDGDEGSEGDEPGDGEEAEAVR